MTEDEQGERRQRLLLTRATIELALFLRNTLPMTGLH